MREKWGELSGGRRVLVIINLALVAVFLLLYCTIGRQQGVKEGRDFLRLSTEGEAYIYRGRLDGRDTEITVRPGGVVEYKSDGILCGPYTIVFGEADPNTPIPYIVTDASGRVGVEITGPDGETVFSGSYMDKGLLMLIDGEGNLVWSGGNSREPDPYTIVSYALGPDTESRGEFTALFLGIVIAAVNIISILFADGLFRFAMSFRIADPDSAEPSDWELFTRWVSWIVLTAAALIVFIAGL